MKIEIVCCYYSFSLQSQSLLPTNIPWLLHYNLAQRPLSLSKCWLFMFTRDQLWLPWSSAKWLAGGKPDNPPCCRHLQVKHFSFFMEFPQKNISHHDIFSIPLDIIQPWLAMTSNFCFILCCWREHWKQCRFLQSYQQFLIYLLCQHQSSIEVLFTLIISN